MDEKIYEDIINRVKKRYDRRKEYFSHAVAYLAAMGMMWFVWLDPSDFMKGFGVLGAIITVPWTIGILIHSVQWLFDELQERAVNVQLARAGINTAYVKAKREERLVRLSDDGELIDFKIEDETHSTTSAESE